MKFFSLISKGNIHLAAGKKIIPAQEVGTLLKAQEILEKSIEDVELYKKETEKECARLKEKAIQEGFDQGLETFNQHLIAFEQELKALRHELQQQILPLALKAAKKIVGKELELHPHTIVDIVIQALAPATQNRRFTIYVNKADKETLEAEKPRIREILEHLENLSIVDRADISLGGCIIETESGIINATIENQWRALEAAFAKYMKQLGS